MLADVVEALRWTGSGVSLLDDVRARFEATLMSSAIARMRTAHLRFRYGDGAFFEQLACADPARLIAAITAPDTFRFLGPNADMHALLDHLQRILSEPASRGDGGIAMGFSAWPDPDFDIPLIEPASLDTDERRSIIRTVEAAFERLALQPAAAQFVHVHTRALAIRRDIGREGFLSTSSPRCPGRTVLINVDHASVEMVADALLHEAVHALLNAVQLLQPFVHDHARLSAVSGCSPWSNQIIPLDALLEACFVWFALSCFWRDATNGEERRLRDRAGRGFAAGPLQTLFLPAASSIDPAALWAIATMQDRILAELQPG